MQQLKRVSIESFLVVILIITLAIAMSIMILQGSKTFDSLLDSKNKTEDFRIAVSYINMLIKQNDSENAIKISKNFAEGKDALTIFHQGDELGLATYIYSINGKLYEEYGQIKEQYELDLATEIIGADVDFLQTGNKIKGIYHTKDHKDYEQIIALRAKVAENEK